MYQPGKLDLVLERIVDVPRELVWKAWTEPKHLMPWFTPDPWKTVDCQIDLRPGGAFNTVFRSPEGKAFPNQGCYLEIVKYEKLVWTDALLPGYRPAAPTDLGFFMSAMILLEAQGNQTQYTAVALHTDEASLKKHEQMGFHEGWGKALDQLVAYVKTLK